jgi:hypothetical protein
MRPDALQHFRAIHEGSSQRLAIRPAIGRAPDRVSKSRPPRPAGHVRVVARELIDVLLQVRAITPTVSTDAIPRRPPRQKRDPRYHDEDDRPNQHEERAHNGADGHETVFDLRIGPAPGQALPPAKSVITSNAPTTGNSVPPRLVQLVPRISELWWMWPTDERN